MPTCATSISNSSLLQSQAPIDCNYVLRRESLKIAFMTHEYPPIIFGSIGGSVKNLAAGLSRLGVKVTVLSGFPVSHPGKGVSREVDSARARK